MKGMRMRFEMKPGKSRASAGSLPRSRASCTIAAAVSSEVWTARITSTSASTGTGLKKCMPITRSGRSVTAAREVMGIELVFDARIALAPRTPSARRKSSSFAAASSVIASTIRSASTSSSVALIRASTSDGSPPPFAASFPRLRSIPLSPRSTAPGYGSCSETRRPDAATTCAMPAPICPAPTTRTCSNVTAREPTLLLVRVRTATAADAAAIAGVQEAGWQVAYRHIFPVAELERGGFIQADRWRGRLADPPPGWSTFVVERDGVVVGFASVGPSRDERGIGELYAIYVDPGAWSTGAGRVLIEQSEVQLRVDFDEATLWVLEDNPRARSFYEAAGWSPDGARKTEKRWGVRAPEVRYRKELKSSRS